jgi:S-adenosyl methyltransferase
MYRDPLEEVLTHRWYGPVLEVLGDGPLRYVDIKAALVVQQRPSPGEGQVNAALKDLAGLGQVEKAGDGLRAPWRLTERGLQTRLALSYLDQLMAGEQRPASSARDTASRLAAEDRFGQTRLAMAARAKQLDVSRPHPARRYNYWLGGKDNFEADRISGDEIERRIPGGRAGVRANRAVLQRAVRYLAGEEGVRQFLDIGTGLPTADNTHEVAQAVAPQSRIVYVDNDPLVLVHARALLTSAPEGRTAYIEADLRDPAQILNAPEVLDTLDLTQPVALLLVAVLHFLPGDVKPIVDQLMNALPPGSFLAVTHFTVDFHPPALLQTYGQMVQKGNFDFHARTKAQISELFESMEMVPPGIVPNTHWRPEPGTPEIPLHVVAEWAGVGRKK